MVGVGARVRRLVPLSLLLAASVLMGLAQGTLSASVTLERLEFEVLTDHDELPVDSAVVGDTVRIAAVLAPSAEAVSSNEVQVTFYYEDRISKETARIGSATVPGFYLAVGSFRRAVFEWQTDFIRPGLYNIFAVGDFDVSSGDGAGALKTLTVLKDGTYVGFLLNEAGQLVVASGSREGEPVVPLCAMGETVARVQSDDFGALYVSKKFVEVEVVNLGTNDLELADFMKGNNGEPQLRCWYRSTGSDEAGFRELSNACWISSSSISISPGEEKTIRLFFQYTFGFGSSALGEPEAVQLKLQAYDNAGLAISDPVFLPGQAGEIRMFSWADLWTSPDPGVCCPECDPAGELEVSLPPVVVQGSGSLGSDSAFLVFHAVTSGGTSALHANEIALNANFGSLRYVKEIGPRWATPWEPASGTIQAVTAAADASGVMRIFVATDDGNAYGILDTVNDTSFFAGQDFHQLWGPVSFPGSGVLIIRNPPLVVKNVAANLDLVVFATSRGLFAYNTSNGVAVWQVTDSDMLPIVGAAAAGGHIWFASQTDVYHFEASETTPRPDEVTRAGLTSTITAKEFADGSVGAAFAEGGFVLFHDPTATGGDLQEISACTRCDVVAVGLGGGSVGTATIYAASEDDVYKIQASRPLGGRVSLALADERSGCVRPVFQGTPTGIAVLVDLDASTRAVFVTTDQGELRSFTEDLCQSVNAVLWPTYDAATGSPSGTQSNYEAFKVTLDDPVTLVLTAPAVGVLNVTDEDDKPLLEVLLFGASDGRVYALDLTRAGRETWYWDWVSF